MDDSHLQITKPGDFHPRFRPRVRFLRTRISRARYLQLTSLAFALLIGGWTAASALEVFPKIFLPSPLEVAKSLVDGFVSGELWLNIWASLWRVMVGFLIGAGVALPVGILTGNVGWAEALLQPLTEFLRYMPVPAFLPLCILWFGIGELEKIVVIFLGTFFQLAVLVFDDARAVPNEFLEIGYTLGLSRMESLSKVVLPSALPRIFEDLRVSFGWAWSYVVVAELVAANHGVGFMIMQSHRYLRTADVIAGILVIGILGLVSDLFFRGVSRVLFPYEDSRL